MEKEEWFSPARRFSFERKFMLMHKEMSRRLIVIHASLADSFRGPFLSEEPRVL